MSEFPPEELRGVVGEVAGLLKEKGETVCVAETVCLSFLTKGMFLCLVSFAFDCLLEGWLRFVWFRYWVYGCEMQTPLFNV